MGCFLPRLLSVRERMSKAAEACGRDPQAIQLIAVSKGKPIEAIREAYGAGQRAFGESYAQELALKAESLADLHDIQWHFIGHLQTNKAKIIAQHAHIVHALSSIHAARVLARHVERRGRTPMPVFIEVNLSGEPQKYGVASYEMEEIINAIQQEPALTLRGLMTIPPAGDAQLAKKLFDTLATLRTIHGGSRILPELSMGMSQDFEQAIAAGATSIRIGTAIFGERNKVHRAS